MLLERLLGKASESPEYDWDGYYGWLYGQLAGEDAAEVYLWNCRHCNTLNVVCLPTRYAKCHECDLIYMGHQLPVMRHI